MDSSCLVNDAEPSANGRIDSFPILDHRSTSSSPENAKTSSSENSRLMQNIGKYIDFNSPILKHLIDIEKKYWNSQANQNFVFPKLEVSRDNEVSIQSLHDVTTYDLQEQNHRRQEEEEKEESFRYKAKWAMLNSNKEKKAMDIVTIPYEKKTKNNSGTLFDSSQRHEGKRKRVRGPQEVSQEIGSQKSYSRRNQESQEVRSRDKSSNKLQDKIMAKLKLKSIWKGLEVRGDSRMGSKTPRKKSPGEVTSSVTVKKHTPDSLWKKKTPGRYKSSREGSHGPPVQKDLLKNFISKREPRQSSKADPNHILKHSYLKLDNIKSRADNSAVDPGKLFLKKYNNLFGTHQRTSKSRERHTKRLEESKSKQRKQKGQMKLFSGHTALIPNQNMTQTSRHNKSSRMLLSKIGSGILGIERRVESRVKMDAKGNSYSGLSREISSHLTNTPRENKGSRAAILNLRCGTGYETFTRLPNSSVKHTAVKIANSIGNSVCKQRKRNFTPLLASNNLTTRTMVEPKPKRRTSSKNRLKDQIKLAEIEKQIFTSGFKHKMWDRVFSSTKQPNN